MITNEYFFSFFCLKKPSYPVAKTIFKMEPLPKALYGPHNFCSPISNQSEQVYLGIWLRYFLIHK